MPQAKIHCHAHDVENSFGHIRYLVLLVDGRRLFVMSWLAIDIHSLFLFAFIY